MIQKKNIKKQIISSNIDAIIRDAWEDTVSFDEMTLRYGISFDEIRKIMSSRMTDTMFKKWQDRIHKRPDRHVKKYREITKGIN
jgi:uncharacterized protein (TIGR03643 family)